MNANANTSNLPQAPALEPYGNGRNATAVVLSAPNGDTLKLWYSYRTCVAFAFNGARTVHANDWSNTTGRHLAAIDGGDKQAKRERVDADTFARKLGDALAAFGTSNLATFGADVLREFRERGMDKKPDTDADGFPIYSRLAHGLARDAGHKLASLARGRGLFGEVQS